MGTRASELDFQPHAERNLGSSAVTPSTCAHADGSLQLRPSFALSNHLNGTAALSDQVKFPSHGAALATSPDSKKSRSSRAGGQAALTSPASVHMPGDKSASSRQASDAAGAIEAKDRQPAAGTEEAQQQPRANPAEQLAGIETSAPLLDATQAIQFELFVEEEDDHGSSRKPAAVPPAGFAIPATQLQLQPTQAAAAAAAPSQLPFALPRALDAIPETDEADAQQQQQQNSAAQPTAGPVARLPVAAPPPRPAPADSPPPGHLAAPAWASTRSAPLANRRGAPEEAADPEGAGALPPVERRQPAAASEQAQSAKDRAEEGRPVPLDAAQEVARWQEDLRSRWLVSQEWTEPMAATLTGTLRSDGGTLASMHTSEASEAHALLVAHSLEYKAGRAEGALCHVVLSDMCMFVAEELFGADCERLSEQGNTTWMHTLMMKACLAERTSEIEDAHPVELVARLRFSQPAGADAGGGSEQAQLLSDADAEVDKYLCTREEYALRQAAVADDGGAVRAWNGPRRGQPFAKEELLELRGRADEHHGATLPPAADDAGALEVGPTLQGPTAEQAAAGADGVSQLEVQPSAAAAPGTAAAPRAPQGAMPPARPSPADGPEQLQVDPSGCSGPSAGPSPRRGAPAVTPEATTPQALKRCRWLAGGWGANAGDIIDATAVPPSPAAAGGTLGDAVPPSVGPAHETTPSGLRPSAAGKLAFRQVVGSEVLETQAEGRPPSGRDPGVNASPPAPGNGAFPGSDHAVAAAAAAASEAAPSLGPPVQLNLPLPAAPACSQPLGSQEVQNALSAVARLGMDLTSPSQAAEQLEPRRAALSRFARDAGPPAPAPPKPDVGGSPSKRPHKPSRRYEGFEVDAAARLAAKARPAKCPAGKAAAASRKQQQKAQQRKEYGGRVMASGRRDLGGSALPLVVQSVVRRPAPPPRPVRSPQRQQQQEALRHLMRATPARGNGAAANAAVRPDRPALPATAAPRKAAAPRVLSGLQDIVDDTQMKSAAAQAAVSPARRTSARPAPKLAAIAMKKPSPAKKEASPAKGGAMSLKAVTVAAAPERRRRQQQHQQQQQGQQQQQQQGKGQASPAAEPHDPFRFCGSEVAAADAAPAPAAAAARTSPRTAPKPPPPGKPNHSIRRHCEVRDGLVILYRPHPALQTQQTQVDGPMGGDQVRADPLVASSPGRITRLAQFEAAAAAAVTPASGRKRGAAAAGADPPGGSKRAKASPGAAPVADSEDQTIAQYCQRTAGERKSAAAAAAASIAAAAAPAALAAAPAAAVKKTGCSKCRFRGCRQCRASAAAQALSPAAPQAAQRAGTSRDRDGTPQAAPSPPPQPSPAFAGRAAPSAPPTRRRSTAGAGAAGAPARPLSGMRLMITGFQKEEKAAVAELIEQLGAEVVAEMPPPLSAGAAASAHPRPAARRLSMGTRQQAQQAQQVDAVVAPRYARTTKCLLAAARGLPVVRPAWVAACAAAGARVAWRKAHLLLEARPALRDAPVLSGARVHLHAGRRVAEQFSQLLVHAGAAVVSSLEGGAAGCDAVIMDNDEPASEAAVKAHADLERLVRRLHLKRYCRDDIIEAITSGILPEGFPRASSRQHQQQSEEEAAEESRTQGSHEESQISLAWAHQPGGKRAAAGAAGVRPAKRRWGDPANPHRPSPAAGAAAGSGAGADSGGGSRVFSWVGRPQHPPGALAHSSQRKYYGAFRRGDALEFAVGSYVELAPGPGEEAPRVAQVLGLWGEVGTDGQERCFGRFRRFYRPQETTFGLPFLAAHQQNQVFHTDHVEERVPLAAVAARCALAFPHTAEQLSLASPEGGARAAYTCMLRYDHEQMTLTGLPPQTQGDGGDQCAEYQLG